MSHKITISLSNISEAIKQINAYKDSLEKKKKVFMERLATVGGLTARQGFSAAIYDGDSNVEVYVEETDTGYRIVATGQAVAFIEFGAGVYYNPGEPYPLPRPEGIVGIGEYGNGFGKRRAWGYKDNTGQLVVTHGNSAQMPMYNATQEMVKRIVDIAKEVFGSD